VEMGITNELFQTERDETPHASSPSFPTPSPTPRAKTAVDAASPIEKFAFFMRFLAPPEPSRDAPGGADRSRGAESCSPPSGAPSAIIAPTFNTGNSAVAALRQSAGESLLRSAGPRHGPGAGRWGHPGTGGSQGVSHRSPVGPGTAAVLPARRATSDLREASGRIAACSFFTPQRLRS